MAGGGGGSDGDVGFQIAPMIDLILVLMVFFMSTVALKQVENELAITLPGNSLAKTDGKTNVPMNIDIYEDGSVNLNGETIAPNMEPDLSRLITKLQEQVQIFDDKIPVIITPKDEVLHRRVIDVLNACAAAKVRNIAFGR